MQVSIYMPTRNRVGLLRRATESALKQTYSPLELIVVNDGSSDGTRAYLDALQGMDSRVKVIHNDISGGACRARNQAINAASGEFVTGLDDDDYFHPKRVETLVAHWLLFEAANQPVSCLFTQDILASGATTSVTSKPSSVNADDLFFYNVIGNQIFTRREYLIQAGLYDEAMRAWQDLDVFIRVLKTFGPAMLVNSALYTLNLDHRADRISMGNKARILSAYFGICEKSGNLPPIMRQGLFLQVFGRLYGFPLGYVDLLEFFRYGIHARTLKSLIGIFVRRLSGSNR
jgi:glycosyltransferase involved in cell wall biosynthesis